MQKCVIIKSLSQNKPKQGDQVLHQPERFSFLIMTSHNNI